MRARYPVLISLCVSLLSISAACTDAVSPVTSLDTSVTLQSVTLSPTEATLAVGSHMTMHVALTGMDGHPASAKTTWSSSDTTVATVSDSGNVVAIAPGQAVIMARSGGVYASAPFTIIPQSQPESVTVAPQKANIAIGQTVQLSVATSASTGGAVTWGSSNPQVATVTSSGLVTGVSAGIASIRATKGGQLGVATVTVLAGSSSSTPTAAVASVTLDQSSAAMTVGDTVRIAATPRDASGAALDGRTVTWSSSNSSIASVSGSGLITAITAGSAEVTATSEGITGTLSVTVAAPSSDQPSVTGASWSNQPTSLTVLRSTSWPTLVPSGWGLEDPNHHASLVTDSSAPFSPQTVINMLYPAGFPGTGIGPSEVYTPLGGKREVYAGFWWKASPNWQGHPSGVNKIAFMFPYGSNGQDYIMMRGPNGGPYHIRVESEFNDGTGSIVRQPNRGDVTIVPGNWYKIEWYERCESSPGANDGVIRWWVNGTLIGEYTGLRTPGTQMSEFQFAPTWGGVDKTVTKQHDDYYRFGPTRISTH